jgi:hypothetical protein
MKKRILSVIIGIAVMLSVTIQVSAFTPAVSNGNPSIDDALEILMYLAGMENSVEYDEGEAPTINDALEILMYLAGLSSAFDTVQSWADCAPCNECDYCKNGNPVFTIDPPAEQKVPEVLAAEIMIELPLEVQ